MKTSIGNIKKIIRESLRIPGSRRIALQNGAEFLASIKKLAREQCDTQNSVVEAWVYNKMDEPGVRYIKRATYLDLVVNAKIASTWLWENGAWQQVETRVMG